VRVLQIHEVNVNELVLNGRNPRRMRPERKAQFLKTLTEERGLTEARPVIARRSDKVVIAGNMRLQGARELGWETIPAVFVDVDDLRAATWTFLDNRQFGEDDEDLAAELLAELEERGGDLELTGFARTETDALLRRLLYRAKRPRSRPPPPRGRARLGARQGLSAWPPPGHVRRRHQSRARAYPARRRRTDAGGDRSAVRDRSR
jgi:ParB-like chromosome segregation protein Spo0J